MAFELGPFEPIPPFQPDAEYLELRGVDTTVKDTAQVYITITVSGTDVYEPGCFIIGEGDAELRWTWEDELLRWLGADADLRWQTEFRLGTGQC